ncbi:DNA translocase FtsK [Vibrio sp. 03-59-1]|uniref:DNA translocase FtsK 4TM domain-containing protein n=1 Tax=Vibrio sp. 03-59-1 TaxID=2607607 RepID=UPI001493A4F4|nr:DNA translocase FtsK 4TM domain-containing protein [Vibrio sp. 03-59-1]NOH83244.1 DNA translocase FtsK [Vibrio sp. 03-59-1]
MFRENTDKVETIVKTSEEPQSSRLDGVQRLKECGLILGVLASILLSIALFTFNPADPSWSQTAWGGDIQNAGGIVGAWIADTLFFIFGSLAYLIPLIVIIAAWVLCRKRGEQDDLDFVLWGTRLLGLSILILTSCGLADTNFDDIWYFSSGGVVGDVLTNLSLPVLNILGTTLVLLFLWGAGFTLLTGISWLSIVEGLGNGAIGACTWGLNKLRDTDREVLEPVLDDIDHQEFTTEKAHLPDVESRSESTEHLVSQENASSLEDESQANNYTDTIDTDDAERDVKPRYNIHMPAESTSGRGASIAASIPASSYQPEHYDEEPELSVDRSKQLTATIEELEYAAQSEDDFAQENLEDEISRIASFASENVEVNAEQEPLYSPQTEFQPEPEYQNEVNTDFSEPIADFTVEDEVNQPRISEFGLEQMTDVDTPNHIEPVISDLDILEEDSDSVTHHESEEVVAFSDVDLPAEVNATESDIEVVEGELEHPDKDVQAFQEIISAAQENVAGAQNPFLVQQEINLPKPAEPLPTLQLLYHPEKRENFIDRDALEEIARLVESKLADYKIKATVVDIFPGPVITRFELDLAPGVKVSRISSLSMDLARSLSAIAVRVVEVIPGKPYVGLELPNVSRQTVYLSDVINSPQFEQSTSPTTVVLGQDIAGEAVVADLSKMPHVLVAGTTGSGKSVGVNVMILSMLYKASPDEVRFIMIDPKMLELSIYEGIPHLLSEVVTDMKDASNALRWCVGEMERRYKLMSAVGVRNLKGYNEKLKMAAEAGHPIHDPFWKEGDSMDTEAPLLENLPYIVVVVDEFADLIMVVGKKVEELIARLAQKARAAGIHLILATQRPSVDVITGIIKANIPTRIGFTVSTKIDSRTILDQGGAESLLGMGDMLYLPPGSNHTIRVHGAFASDDDVHAVVNNWKARGKPVYIDEIVNGEQTADSLLPGEQLEKDEDTDPLFDQVVEHVTESRRGSVSGVQRKFKIGYNRAARIVEQLEAQGIVSAPGHNGNREVIAPPPIKDM